MPRGFGPSILLLLRVQSFLDAVACLFTTIIILAPEDLLSGVGKLVHNNKCMKTKLRKLRLKAIYHFGHYFNIFLVNLVN